MFSAPDQGYLGSKYGDTQQPFSTVHAVISDGLAQDSDNDPRNKGIDSRHHFIIDGANNPGKYLSRN